MPHRTVDYRQLFDSIDEGFCIIEVMVDPDRRPCDYRFLETNSSFEEQTGLVGAVGKTMRELAPGHEDHWFAIYGRVAATGEPARFENRAEQLHRWYDVYAFRIGDPDERHVAVLFRDITARKANEEAARTIADELRASERRLRAVFENAATGILQTDQQDRFVAANDRVCQMLGYRREDLIGMSVDELTYPEDRPLSRRLNQEVHDGPRRVLQYETRYVKRDGSPLWVLVAVSAVRDDAGQYLYSIGTVVDISERKEAEAQVRLHAAALEAAPNAVSLSTTDSKGTIVWVNAAFTKLTGYSPEDVIGRSHHVLSSGQQDEAYYQRLWATIARGEVWRGELVNRRKDGTLYYEEMGITPLADDSGEITHYVAIKQDVTARKQAEAALRESEARFRHLADAVPLMVWQCGPDRQCDYFNRAWLEFTGRSLKEEQGSGWAEGVHEEDRAACLEVFEGAAERYESFEVEYRLRHRSGEYRWVLDRGQPRFHPDGTFIGYVGAAADIHRRRQAEAALAAARQSAERAKAAAEEASRAKDHFLAVLSHELRTPLTPALASLSLLESEPAWPASTRARLEVIHRNIELEARLIDDLLDVTRIARGKIDLDRKRVRLIDVIQRAVEVVQPDIDARRLHFGVHTNAEPYVVDADATRLQQVFWNLLRNAIKFTPRGGCLGVSCRAGDDGKVVVEVQDSGEGIDPDALPHIFNAFEQAERSIKRQFGGLGLGLTISKALVEMHGGTIEAESDGRGKGATFRVHLPLVPVEPDVPGPSSERRSAVPLRILLVEDHGDTAEMLGMLLAMEGHDVERVADVSSAIEAVSARTFDLLLSDLGLPDASGLELMRQLRERGVAFPGIAISGYGQEEDIRQSHQAGFSAHLTKPASPERLAEVIGRVMGWPRPS